VLVPHSRGRDQSTRASALIVRAAASARSDGKDSPYPLAVQICGPDISPQLLSLAEATVDTPFASLAYVRAFQPEICTQLQHAVAWRGQELIGILSFYPRGTALVVVNRLVRLSDAVLERCAAAMLAWHPRAQSVRIDDLYGSPAGGSQYHALRSRTWSTMDCVVLELPHEFSAYLERFGPATRKNLRYCARRLEREAPAVKFRMCQREQIDGSVVAGLVRLNHERMASKGTISGIDDAYQARLTALCRSHGIACIATDGATIVGGTLCTQVAGGWTLHVIAHDPKFNHVRLGLLCLLRTVEQAIASGAARFNLLWGVGDYKLLFGGTVVALRARRYYRSVAAQVRALADMRDCAAQCARRGLSRLRRRWYQRPTARTT
jgi:hypothetical protein